MKYNFDMKIPYSYTESGKRIRFKVTSTHINIEMEGEKYGSGVSRKIPREEIRSSEMNLIELALEEMELELDEFEYEFEQTEEFKNE